MALTKIDFSGALLSYTLTAYNDVRLVVAFAQYELGDGVPQNYILAHMWYNLAAALGYRHPIANRDLIARNMTQAQIAEAQRLAREWKPKH